MRPETIFLARQMLTMFVGGEKGEDEKKQRE